MADLRDLAVANVDRRHGYTYEFAPSPAAHLDEYDVEEARLRAHCPGGYIGINDPRVGPDRAPCPSCGRIVGFDRITGRFRRHRGPAR